MMEACTTHLVKFLVDYKSIFREDIGFPRMMQERNSIGKENFAVKTSENFW